jgi:hypothetical protein
VVYLYYQPTPKPSLGEVLFRKAEKVTPFAVTRRIRSVGPCARQSRTGPAFEDAPTRGYATGYHRATFSALRCVHGPVVFAAQPARRGDRGPLRPYTDLWAGCVCRATGPFTFTSISIIRGFRESVKPQRCRCQIHLEQTDPQAGRDRERPLQGCGAVFVGSALRPRPCVRSSNMLLTPTLFLKRLQSPCLVNFSLDLQSPSQCGINA